MSDHTLTQIQIIIFLSTLDLSKKVKLANDLQEASDGLFDGEPLLIPIPDDAPKEFPRLVLQSREKDWQLQIMAERLVLVQKQDEITDMQSDRILELCAKIWDTIQEKYSASGNRIALVGDFSVATKNGVDFLTKNFIRSSGAAPTPNELEVNVLHKIHFAEFQVNRWTRCRATETGVISLKVDINTFPDLPLEITTPQISNFFSHSKMLLIKTAHAIFASDSAEEQVF